MEAYYNYKGYGVEYSSMTGDTTVSGSGMNLVRFTAKGEAKGKKLAEEWIDVRKEAENGKRV